MDDNGNRFLIQEGIASRDEADRLVAEFTARGHKQVYWAERVVTETSTQSTESADVSLDEHASEADERAIRKGVSEFGDRFTPPRNWRPVTLGLRAADGNIIGGLLGSTTWDWLQIDTLWVAEEFRGRGHGRALVTRAEQIARRHGCRNARVDTFDFEARGFYEKLGYRVYGELHGFPHGHSQLHLAKRFEEP
jgi:ribosomal protein S18 acetylase RimI-like enzyme